MLFVDIFRKMEDLLKEDLAGIVMGYQLNSKLINYWRLNLEMMFILWELINIMNNAEKLL